MSETCPVCGTGLNWQSDQQLECCPLPECGIRLTRSQIALARATAAEREAQAVRAERERVLACIADKLDTQFIVRRPNSTPEWRKFLDEVRYECKTVMAAARALLDSTAKEG